MRNTIFVLLFCAASFGCDDLKVPLQRRTMPQLGELALSPDAGLFSFASGFTASFSGSVIPYEVPAHYECSKSAYGVDREKTENGNSVSCRKDQ